MLSVLWRAAAVAVLIACAFVRPADASSFYFHVNQGEEKCFIEELPEGVTLVVKYETKKYDHNERRFVHTDTGVHLHVVDPLGVTDMNSDFTSKNTPNPGTGKVYYHTSHYGEHTVCISADTRQWVGGHQMRIHLTLEIRDTQRESDSKEYLVEGLEGMLKDSIRQANAVAKEQKYQKDREHHFREISELTNTKVMWWTIIQTIVLLGMALWQMMHLKSFFKAKKIV